MHVEDFVYQPERPHRDVLVYLHEMLTNTYGLIPRIKHGIPFYDQRKWVCYLNPVRNKGIELAFIHGNLLSNEYGILEARGRKQVSGIIIESLEHLPHEAIEATIHEALLIDELTDKNGA